MGTWSIEPSDSGAIIDDYGKVTFPTNTGFTQKEYTIKYTDGDMVCEKKVLQEATSCGCDILTFNQTVEYVRNDGVQDLEIGTIALTREACRDFVVANSSSSSLTLRLEGDSVIANVDRNDGDPRMLEFEVYIDTEEGCTHETHYLYQQCWRGTDNGTDKYIKPDGSYEIHSWDLYMNSDYSHNGDSIAVSSITLDNITYYDGNGDPNDPSSYIDDDGSHFTWRQTSQGTNIIGDLNYKATIALDGIDNFIMYWDNRIPGVCNVGMLGFSALTTSEQDPYDNNSVYGYRSFKFLFRTSANNIMTCNIAHKGESCCKIWELEIKQCEQGYKWYSKYGHNVQDSCMPFKTEAEAIRKGYPYEIEP